MRINKSTLAVLVLILIAGFWFLRKRNQEVAALAARSEAANVELSRQVRDLGRRVVEAERRAETIALSPPVPELPEPTPALASPAPVPPPAIPGVSIEAPAGWYENGNNVDAYVVGVDQTQMLNGLPSAYVSSIDPNATGFGGMMQTASAEPYAGKRVRYAAWIRSADVGEGGGHLWLRVDGTQPGPPLGFDNMNNRALKGTTEWRYESVVLDVPANAQGLAFGFFIGGPGRMWVNSASIQEVGPEVPTTNMLGPAANRSSPQNLNFSE